LNDPKDGLMLGFARKTPEKSEGHSPPNYRASVDTLQKDKYLQLKVSCEALRPALEQAHG